MLAIKSARTAALLILAICSLASWHIALPFLAYESCALTPAPGRGVPILTRDLNSTVYDNYLYPEETPDMDVIDQRDDKKEEEEEEKIPDVDPKEMPDYGAVKSKLISLIAENSYYFVMNLPLPTAEALIGYTLKGIEDSDIIAMLKESRSFTVELYPDLMKGHLIEDGYCLIEFSFPVMGDDPGVVVMVCLSPGKTSGFGGNKGYFLAKNLAANKPPVDVDNPKNYGLFVKIDAPPWDRKTSTNCLEFDYQNTYNELFGKVDDYVYNVLGYRRSIYMYEDTQTVKENVRKAFLMRFYDYARPLNCSNDVGLLESIKKSTEKFENTKKSAAKLRKIIPCPSNLKAPDIGYKSSLLSENEVMVLRSFNLYDQTDFNYLLDNENSYVGLTKGECMFSELTHNYDYSAEYRLNNGHYVRIEYIKGKVKKNFDPGMMLYISIDVYGSVDVFLLIGRTPDPKIPHEYNDYIRTVKYKNQPYYSDVYHIVRAKSVVHEEYNQPHEELLKSYLPGYQLACRDPYNIYSYDAAKLRYYADNLYTKIFVQTGLEKFLGKTFPHCSPYRLSYGPISESYIYYRVCPNIKRSRMDFLRRALAGTECYDFTFYKHIQYMLPVLYNSDYVMRQAPEPSVTPIEEKPELIYY